MPRKARFSYLTTAHLIRNMSKKHKLTKVMAGIIVRSVFDSISKALKAGSRVEIRGFGSFELRRYKAYQGRNPQTGAKIHVKSKILPFFKIGKLKDTVNKK